MYNFYDKIVGHPGAYRQFNCRGALITLFNCPLENRYQDLWSHHNYIVFVTEGRKIWHTPAGSYDLNPGSCVLVRKGASIVEQFFDAAFCIVLFFIPDDFICDVLRTKVTPLQKADRHYGSVIPLHRNEPLDGFFRSMNAYFASANEPDAALLELKFRELILTIADNRDNTELLSYFCTLLNAPQAVSLQQVMDDNYCFNLKIEEFAQLSHRSLSAFKRDFHKHYGSTPGKWLLEKRLQHAMHLLSTSGKSVSEAAFESGFENPSHFSRAFRKHFGMAPTGVRAQLAG